MTTKERVYWYTENEAEICAMYESGVTPDKIAKTFNVHASTVRTFLKTRRIKGAAAPRWRREMSGW